MSGMGIKIDPKQIDPSLFLAKIELGTVRKLMRLNLKS